MIADHIVPVVALLASCGARNGFNELIMLVHPLRPETRFWAALEIIPDVAMGFCIGRPPIAFRKDRRVMRDIYPVIIEEQGQLVCILEYISVREKHDIVALEPFMDVLGNLHEIRVDRRLSAGHLNRPYRPERLTDPLEFTDRYMGVAWAFAVYPLSLSRRAFETLSIASPGYRESQPIDYPPFFPLHSGGPHSNIEAPMKYGLGLLQYG